MSQVPEEVAGAGAGGVEGEDLPPNGRGGVVVETEAGAVDGTVQTGCVVVGVVEVGSEAAWGGVDEVLAVGEDLVEEPGLGGVVGEVT
ncbi:hypothetical protein ABZX62_26820 [Streptomyces flavidovirens]|uniref:hypothetical protein n=1 Tax=Streptomyces flavidovirens TaxID=67298 RepID=UPI0033A88473